MKTLQQCYSSSTIVILFFSNKVGEICMGSKLWQAIKSKRDNLLKPV